MHDLAPLIYDLAVMLGIAGIVVLVFQRIHQPVVLGYLVAGMIIGPYTPPYGFVTDIPNIEILSELGVIFLMFSLGLEFSFHKLTKVGFSALITGVIDVSFMVILGYCTGLLLGWEFNDRIFLGAALAISSTTIIIKAVNELGLKTKRFSEVIFGVLIVEDLLAILLLVALSTIVVTKNIFSADMFFAAIKLVLVVGAWFLAGYFILPSLFRRVAGYVNQETLTIVSIGLCLFLVSIAAYFHYSTALGAFIMGSILAETVLIHRIEELIIPIRDIFGAVFFISIGMLINPAVIFAQWQSVLVIALVLMLGKVFVITVGTFLTGQSYKTAIRSGFGMAQIGEFSFIIATLGLSLHVISDTLYPVIVAVSGITTFTTPYMFKLSDKISKGLIKHLPDRIKYNLDSYTDWVYKARTGSRKNPLVRKITMRLIINGITMALIFIMTHKYVYPNVLKLANDEQLAKILSEVIAITLSSPFIWGMLFSYKSSTLTIDPKYKTHLVFFVWFLTLVEIVSLSIFYFNTWIATTLFVILAATFFAISYRQLEKSYRWFERQLVKNIKKEPAKQSRYRELAPWDTHLVEMKVGNKSSFVGKTLGANQIRELYHVNVVAIHRGQHTITAPRGEEFIYYNDKLIVLGNDEQIDKFKKQVSVSSHDHEKKDQLENFALHPVLLDNDHPLVGKTIRNSKIREKLNCLIVGIERGTIQILNPDPETILMADDLLLLVGENKKIDRSELKVLLTS